MAKTKEEIRKRIDEILSRQENLEGLVSSLQDDFFNEVLTNYSFIVKSPRAYSQFFARFTKDYHVPVLRQLIEDMSFIIEGNASYFAEQFENVDDKISAIEQSLLRDLGVSSTGAILPDTYFADLVTDTGLKRTFRAALLKFGTEKTMSKEHKEILESFIKGDKKNLGIFESFYSKNDRAGGNIFDNYQRADRLAQQQFSEGLGVQARMYVGGLIDGSRLFCIERNGKIFLDSEIEAWRKLSFDGKPKVYEPLIDLGGIRCRHTLSGLSNATALRLDNTLRETKGGKLYRVES